LPWPWFSPNLQGCAESSSLTRPWMHWTWKVSHKLE
jgi:hypothetical protein